MEVDDGVFIFRGAMCECKGSASWSLPAIPCVMRL